MGELDGRAALVTGGGTGIGAAIAEVFAADGSGPSTSTSPASGTRPRRRCPP